jgi:hypothetical protein
MVRISSCAVSPVNWILVGDTTIVRSFDVGVTWANLFIIYFGGLDYKEGHDRSNKHVYRRSTQCVDSALTN